MTVVLKTHRFTVDDYHRMGEVGILSEDDRPDGYQEVGILYRSNSVAPQAFPDLTLTVTDLLGP